LFRNGQLYLINTVEKAHPMLRPHHHRQLKSLGVKMIAYRASDVSGNPGAGLHSIRRVLESAERSRRTQMSSQWQPTTYYGPYGKMNAACPATTQQLDMYMASDVGYSRGVSDVAASASTVIDVAAVERELTYMLNVANVLYEDQVNVFLRAKTFDVRTAVGASDYSWNMDAYTTGCQATIDEYGASYPDEPELFYSLLSFRWWAGNTLFPSRESVQ
jgi:hypothetical protein